MGSLESIFNGLSFQRATFLNNVLEKNYGSRKKSLQTERILLGRYGKSKPVTNQEKHMTPPCEIILPMKVISFVTSPISCFERNWEISLEWLLSFLVFFERTFQLKMFQSLLSFQRYKIYYDWSNSRKIIEHQPSPANGQLLILTDLVT